MFGDFVSDDGSARAKHVYLDQGPTTPVADTAGTTVRVRYGAGEVLPESGASGWSNYREIALWFGAAFVVGWLMIRPWQWPRRWRAWRTRRGSG